ncbi:MAG: hypothetical protein LKF30_10385 [Sphingobium sp.]|nr:hypothetical protein [Sphingobium sp.]MCI1271012.1 hypothetical protein [Sphingobium sp.]
MATVGSWLRGGWRWWTNEIAAIVPASLRKMGQQNSPHAVFRDERIDFRDGIAGTAERPRPVNLALAPSQSLQRFIDLPAMGLSDIRSMMALEANRLFPLASDSLLVDAEIEARRDNGKTLQVRVVAIRRELAESAVSTALMAGIIPRRIGIGEGEHPDHLHFDFAPQMRALGMLPPKSQAPGIWWALVGALFLLNIGLLVWRDQQKVAQLEATVEAQQPAVSVYRTIATRTARVEQIARTTASRRASHDAMGDLAAATAALPDGAWVQRYDWNGASLRLAGYYRSPIDVNASLGRSERFINVRTSGSDVQADIPIGRPFDVTADVRRGGR